VVAVSALEAPGRAKRALRMALAARDAHADRRIATGPLNHWFRDLRRGPGGEAYDAVRYVSQAEGGAGIVLLNCTCARASTRVEGQPSSFVSCSFATRAEAAA